MHGYWGGWFFSFSSCTCLPVVAGGAGPRVGVMRGRRSSDFGATGAEWGTRVTRFLVVLTRFVAVLFIGLFISLYSTDVQKGDFPAGRRDFVGKMFRVVRDLARDRR